IGPGQDDQPDERQSEEGERDGGVHDHRADPVALLSLELDPAPGAVPRHPEPGLEPRPAASRAAARLAPEGACDYGPVVAQEPGSIVSRRETRLGPSRRPPKR